MSQRQDYSTGSGHLQTGYLGQYRYTTALTKPSCPRFISIITTGHSAVCPKYGSNYGNIWQGVFIIGTNVDYGAQFPPKTNHYIDTQPRTGIDPQNYINISCMKINRTIRKSMQNNDPLV